MAVKVLHRRKIKHLAVAENGRLLGITSLSALAAPADEEAGKLEDSLNFFTDVVHAQARDVDTRQLQTTARRGDALSEQVATG